ncbi:hypothetical protein BN2476_380034 [Paraburkholderia piptadeniae]|uniref:Uncharacterized protein n=1 Tax=Paraburkholderia piptadeniae TaxID=1701573 RepID=A0A1N7S9W4_9BURK|nr:hypothetical protein BN2476_380034 [Paraburkholderia piptadeniae]
MFRYGKLNVVASAIMSPPFEDAGMTSD